MDKETQEILSKGDRIKNLVAQPGWKDAKDELFDMIKALNVLNIDIEGVDANKIVDEIRMAQGVVKLFNAWVDRIEGTANSHEDLVDSLKDEEDNTLLYNN